MSEINLLSKKTYCGLLYKNHECLSDVIEDPRQRSVFPEFQLDKEFSVVMPFSLYSWINSSVDFKPFSSVVGGEAFRSIPLDYTCQVITTVE